MKDHDYKRMRIHHRPFERLLKGNHAAVFSGYGIHNRKRRENMKRRAYFLTI